MIRGTDRNLSHDVYLAHALDWVQDFGDTYHPTMSHKDDEQEPNLGRREGGMLMKMNSFIFKKEN